MAKGILSHVGNVKGRIQKPETRMIEKVIVGMEQTDVEIMVDSGVTVVVFKATSISNAQRIEAVTGQVRDFVGANQPKGVVFDFGEVKFFSSQVLGLLLDIRDRLKSCNGEVVISAIEPQLHRVFTITNLDKIFRFFPDKESAVSALNPGVD